MGIRLLIAMLLVSGVAYAAPIGIAAIVNDDVITTLDVKERRDLVIASAGIKESPQVLKRLTPQIVQTLISERLQMQEAKRLSIVVPKKEIDAAIHAIEAQRGKPKGSLEKFLKEKGVALRQLRQQLEAQLAWGKVVTRKLRRNVAVTEEEIVRTQQAQATMGEEQLRIAAISLPINKPQDEPQVSALAKELQKQLDAGADFNAIASQLSGNPNVELNPSVWVPERALEPSLVQALRSLKPGEKTPPLRSLNSYQIIQLLDRQTVKPVAAETEVALKEILLPVAQEKVDVREIDAMMEIAREVRKNPGTCNESVVAGIEGVDPSTIKVNYVRTRLGDMAPALRIMVERLGVTEVSEPFATKEAVRMLMLCEKIELPTQLPEREKVQQMLFGQKLELEAEKHLRNLRRDAFIDIK
ncbi:MAG: peptidylprolyl isomerase [Rickettsiales bacterium]